MSGIDESRFAIETGCLVLTPVVDLEVLDVLHFVAVAMVPSINLSPSIVLQVSCKIRSQVAFDLSRSAT